MTDRKWQNTVIPFPSTKPSLVLRAVLGAAGFSGCAAASAETETAAASFPVSNCDFVFDQKHQSANPCDQIRHFINPWHYKNKNWLKVRKVWQQETD